MSYDIYLRDPVTKQILHTETKHNLKGGMYCLGGTDECWLNITYNYAEHFYRVFGDNGIRSIYGLTGAESIPVLKAAIAQLKNDVSKDYWEGTEGNAKQALCKLLSLAQLRPDGVWDGD